MLSHDDILQDLQQDESCAQFASIFAEIISLVRIPVIGLGKFDSYLSDLLPIVSIASQFDRRHHDHWLRLELHIPTIRGFIKSHYRDPSIWNHGRSDTKFLVGDYPFFASLTSSSPSTAGARLQALKALMLAAYHTDTYNDKNFHTDKQTFDYDNLKNIADTLRKCANPEWKHFHLLTDVVPDWSSNDIASWTNEFIGNTHRLPRASRRFAYFGRYDYLFQLVSILKYLTGQNGNTASNTRLPQTTLGDKDDRPINTANVILSKLDQSFSTLTGREVRSKRSIQAFHLLPSTTDENNDGIAPDVKTATPQDEVEVNEPEKNQAIQALEVRYTNYRTAMDNQRLPWAWDCLNPLEVRSLTQALYDYQNLSANQELENHRSAFLIWLILLTGQPLQEILNLAINEPAAAGRSSLYRGRFLRRRIPSPLHAFIPKREQSDCLFQTTPIIELALPECVIDLSNRLGLNDPSIEKTRLGGTLGIDFSQADSQVRKFLGRFRERETRLLPGRIRKVLGKEVMNLTNNPVLTHLITACNTDAPPSGVYYSAFSVTRLEEVYRQAVQRIVGTPNAPH